MRNYSNKISLIQNSRGIYCIDPTMGCETGMKNVGGCYNDCYAARSAKTYGYDFGKTVLRYFENRKHKQEIIRQISKVKLDFVRIGCSGDPSENWEHCIAIIKIIAGANKELVIITKHWTALSDEQLNYLKTINVCINTSVSALDEPKQLQKCVEQYQRIKPFCKSVLRIVSCDFNLENETGKYLSEIQHQLFKNTETIDTVFRPSKKNPLVTSGVINIATGNFNGHKTVMSKFNKKTFIGKCGNCREMCGLNVKSEISYSEKPGTIKQLTLF